MNKILTSLLFFSSAILFSQTTISKNILFNGITRNYRIYIPAIYNSSTPVPLVFNLHGYGSNNIQQEGYGNFRPIADTANFILVHPNGTLDGSSQRYWNCFGTPGTGVNDIGFISALIDTVSKLYSINADRIYSTGMSNGGFMSYDLACGLSNRIAAVASVTGTMIFSHKNWCSPTHPVPVMHIHGTADATVSYNGSTSFVPVDSVVSYWVKRNNCTTTPVITTVPDINTTDGCIAENYLYANGDKGSTVELYKVTNGGHSWPGASVNLNVTNMDFSASVEIWRFFRKYSLNNLTLSNNEIEENKNSLILYPNPANDFLSIKFSEKIQDTKISIVNILGHSVYEEKNISQDEYMLNISNWAPGIYFLKLETNGKVFYNKMVKK